MRSKHNDRQRRKAESSDSSDSSHSESEEELNSLAYRKFLAKLFPSHYINRRVKEINSTMRYEDDEDDTSSSDEDESYDDKSRKKGSRKSKRDSGKYKQVTEESEESEELEDDYDEDEDEDYDDEYEDDVEDIGGKQFNIILTLGDPRHYDEDDSYDDDEDYDDYDDEEEYIPKKSSKMELALDEELESLLEPSKDDTKHKDSDKETATSSKEVARKKTKRKNTKTRRKETSGGAAEETSVAGGLSDIAEEELTDKQVLVNFMRMARKLQESNKNKIIDELLDVGREKYKELRKKEEHKDKKAKMKNLQRFRKSLSEKNVMNDYAFFGKMTLNKQEKLIAELEEVNKHAKIETPYRISLLESNIPVKFKGAAMKKINALKYMEPGAGEYYKSKTWVDTFMHIPFDKYHQLPINRSHGIDACHDFMEGAKKTLDTAVYGLNDAKLQIMQMVGQWISNPNAVGTSIAIKGPMGTGKTTLVKEGISKILNREFALIALGGATDSSFLEGHSYTYEGSTWGKIVDILIQSKTMNPIIYFDELDKISDTPKGEEIAGILTHLTDSSQNSHFHDKYFAEIDFDLSKCLFIFSYNDESKINPILKDRMYRIQTKGYSKKEKSEIASSYLLPTIREMVSFDKDDIVIETDALHHIIDKYTEEEQGVRNLKRALEIVHTKLNLYRLMKPDTNLFEEDMSLKVEFPFTVTIGVVDKLLKQSDISSSHMSMYM